MDVLTIRGLKKSFGDKKVLRGVDLTVPEHSIFGFVGRNGAGKTTTMKSIIGLLKPDEGEISILGENVSFGQTSTNKHIGYLPDVPVFYSFLTPREYLHLCGETLEMDSAVIKKRTDELLSLVGLADEKHRIKGFSRGMKQRLGIASALLSSPKLLICDEPTSALDPIGRKEILDILISIKEETTVLFSSHILSDVERICTDVALLNEGKIAMQGTVDELKHIHSANEFIVEPSNAESLAILLKRFSGARLSDNSSLLLSGNDDEIFEMMAFISENRISLRKIERIEPTLESLFMGVIAK